MLIFAWSKFVGINLWSFKYFISLIWTPSNIALRFLAISYQNCGNLKRLFLNIDKSFMFCAMCMQWICPHKNIFWFHLITCLEQSKFVKANYNLSQSQIYGVLEQYDKETENFFYFQSSIMLKHTQKHKSNSYEEGGAISVYFLPFYNI